MWSSWFPNGIFPTRRNKNPNIQKRICGLFEAKMFTPKDSSPMLKELQSCRSKVRRMSSVYEGNIAAYNENIRNDETQRKSLPEQLEAAKEPPQMFVASFPEYESDAIHLIQFILDSDTNYIKRMEVMIEKHVKAFECILALCLKGEDSITNRQKTELFGPIESIHNFHKEIFHPQLLACQHDVVLFAKKISEMCTSGCFNQYLVYGMDEKDCEYRRTVYYKFFLHEIADKVGFPYEFAPIQQLARYRLVLIDMLRVLYKENATVEAKQAMSKADIDWNTMMDKVHQMRKLSYLQR